MLTQQRLKQLLDYDPATGVFVWKKSGKGRNRNLVAGCKCSGTGYILIRVDGVLYLAHRLAWLWAYGQFPTDEIDHRNCIRDDNRLSNLRPASSTDNKRNRRVSKSNSCGRKGVSRVRGGKYRARLMVAQKEIHLGVFNTITAAHAAYDAAAKHHFGSFARVA